MIGAETLEDMSMTREQEDLLLVTFRGRFRDLKDLRLKRPHRANHCRKGQDRNKPDPEDRPVEARVRMRAEHHMLKH